MLSKKVIKNLMLFLINTAFSLSAMEIVVETRDGGKFTFTDETIQESKLLTHMIADCDDTTQNPLVVSDVVTSREMSIIKELSDFLVQQSKTLSKEEILKKCKAFLAAKKLSLNALIPLLNTANYLDCCTLMNIASDLLSNVLIKEFNTTHLEKMLKITQTFTAPPSDTMPAEMSLFVASTMAKKYGFNASHTLPKLLIDEIKNNSPSHFVFSDDKSLIALAMNNCSKVVVWSIQEDSMIAEFASRKCVTALRFSPSNKILAVATEDKIVRLWNLATQKCQLLATSQGPAHSVSFSPNGANLVTSSLLDTKKWLIQIWDAASLENIKKYTTQKAVGYDSQNQLICDKTMAYQRIVEKWHITNPDLQPDIQKLSIEDALTLRWLLEMITIDEKVQLNKAPSLVKEAVKNLMQNKPILAAILQPYLVPEKSSTWCAVS